MFIPMARAIGMNIGMIIPGMEVGCSIGIRLWMNHLGFVFFTLGGGKAPQGEKNKAKVIHPKPDPNGATNLHPWDDHPNVHPNGPGGGAAATGKKLEKDEVCLKR